MLGLTLDSLLYTGAGSSQSEERRQAKAIALNSWYRPHNTVCFVPATPNSELAKKLQEFVDKEMQKINMSAKIVAGISIRDQTVKLQGVPEKTLVSVQSLKNTV